MIYFIGNNEQIKIGYSKKVKNRISSIKTACPFELTLSLIISGDKTKEKELHSKFNKDRVKGEWFTLSEDIRQYISENQINNIDLKIISRKRKIKKLTNLRNSCGLTLKQISDNINVTPQSVFDMEMSFENGSINLNTLKKYLKGINHTFSIEFKEIN